MLSEQVQFYAHYVVRECPDCHNMFWTLINTQSCFFCAAAKAKKQSEQAEKEDPYEDTDEF